MFKDYDEIKIFSLYKPKVEISLQWEKFWPDQLDPIKSSIFNMASKDHL